MPVEPAAVEVLSALAGVLSRWGRWYLFGAQAVVAYLVSQGVPSGQLAITSLPDDDAESAAAAAIRLLVVDPACVGSGGLHD